MTEALFLTVSECEAERREQGKRRLNVSSLLKILGVSRSGYVRFKKKVPSDRELRKCAIKERIREIHRDSHPNYGAPKITECLRKEGETISEKTVGNYMREMEIKAQYVKPVESYISAVVEYEKGNPQIVLESWDENDVGRTIEIMPVL